MTRKEKLEQEIEDLIKSAAVVCSHHMELKKRMAKQGYSIPDLDMKAVKLMEQAVKKEFELSALEESESA